MPMSRLLFSCALLLLPLLARPQLPALITPELEFGVVNELTPDSLTIKLFHAGTDTIRVKEVLRFGPYGTLPFTVALGDSLVLPGDTTRFWVIFSPQHNIRHESELILRTDSHRGSLRIHVGGQGRYSKTYYSTTENLSEEALKTALKQRLAQGYISLSYNFARDEMFMEVDNEKINGQGATVNKLTCVYTGQIITGFSDRTTAQNLGFNTEHTFPQSLFNQDLPMRSDLFHLFPVTESSNSVRSNYPFAVVNNPSWQVGGSELGNGTFEPRDVHKGNAARAMMYFVIRYQDYGGFFAPQEAILRQWHKTFLPTTVDKARNEAILLRQGNRNPFIDYPQFVDRIHSIATSSVAPQISAHLISEYSADYGVVRAGEATVYQIAIANKGTTPLTLNQFTLSDPRLSLPGITSITLDPGYGATLPLTLLAPAADTIAATLQFESTAAGAIQQIQISARVRGTDAVEDNQLNDNILQIYPNPAGAFAELRWRGTPTGFRQVELFDISGKRVQEPLRWNTQETLRLSLEGLPAGVYIVKAGAQKVRLMVE
ncbi:MAG: T9SS C-terminal target domain-containing protein [Bacteroidetes bacterium]|nr:MAG: T9SS C-terminal target domain-containing protein [Bacteroidota bacterium]